MRRGHLIGGIAVLVAAAALCAPYALAAGGSTVGQGYPCATAPGGTSGGSCKSVVGAAQGQQAAGAVAPAHTGGTLPFTGLQLGVFVMLGVLLLGGGLVLRASGRRRSDT